MKTFRQIFKPSSSSPASKAELNLTSQTMSTSPSLIPLTVIELFQSQGCSSCPPANSFLHTHIPANSPTHLLLTYEVTYWDHLGWRDTFGDRRWDARQRDYAAVLRQKSIYTPQVIVDGGDKPLGINGWRDLPGVLGKGEKGAKVGFDFIMGEDGRRVKIGKRDGEEMGQGDVLVVFYEIQPEDVKIWRGENRGETLPHRNVVRDMEAIGEWKGGEEEFGLPAGRKGLEMAILVQAGRGGVIIGAARV